MYFLAAIFAVVLIGFTSFHIRLILTNYTTLEYCEKRRENVSTWQVSPYYSSSMMYNISLKLGFNYFFLWFIPIEPTRARGDGKSFKVFHDDVSNQHDSQEADEDKAIK